MTVREFAEMYADYLSGSAYGQSGNDPKTDLPPPIAEVVRSCVGLGHQAGIATFYNDMARYNYCRESFKKNVPLGKQYGLTFGQMDMAWSIGYTKSRK